MDTDSIFIINKIYQEVNDIHHDYITSCKEYIHQIMLERNTELHLFLQEEINACELYLMIHNWVFNTMSSNQIDKFVINYGIHNMIRHHLEIKKQTIFHNENLESLDFYSNIMFCKELDVMIQVNQNLKVIPQTMVISIIYEDIKNTNHYVDDMSQTHQSSNISSHDNQIHHLSSNRPSLYDLGADNISMIYDELRGKNKNYIQHFNTYFSNTFKCYKCSHKQIDYIHTEKCHDNVANITFEYVQKLNTNDINQIILNYGIGDAIELFYMFYKKQTQDYHQMLGRRIKDNIHWNGIPWNIEIEMVFLIFMEEVYSLHTFE